MMRALLVGVCLALAACGQNAQAPAPADGAAAPVFELPTAYQPVASPHSRDVWFVCDIVGGSRIWVASTPDETGALQLLEYEKGQDAPLEARTMTVLFDPNINNPAQLSFRDTDGLISFSTTLTDDWTVPVDVVAVGLDGEACRLYPRTYAIGFTARRSFVIRDRGNDEIEYLAFDADQWSGAEFIEAPDGTRTTNPSVRAAGALTEQSADTLQWDFLAGSAYAYRVASHTDGGGATLDVLRNGEVISSEPIIAMQLGARR